MLGKGAMGNVYVCRHKETGFFGALKKIKKRTIRDIEQLIYSIKVHMYLNQPNIVKLYSVFND
jgi:serine/threonine protein kinase